MPIRDVSDRWSVVGAEEGTGGRDPRTVPATIELVVRLRQTTQQPNQYQIEPLTHSIPNGIYEIAIFITLGLQIL